VVQGDVALGTRWRSDYYGRNLDVYLRASRRAYEESPGAVVLWPESALTFFLEDEPAYVAAMAHVAGLGGGQLVVGGPRRLDGDPPRYRNSVFVLDASGVATERYDKQHLVPFSEYPPLGRFDFVRRSFGEVRFFEPGGPAPPLPTHAGPAGVLLCNEAMLPEVAGDRVRAGATWLAVPSNDSWIPSERFAHHLFDIVRMRAIEQRRWLVRASSSGPSAIVDPWGRVQMRTRVFGADLANGCIRPRAGRTTYARIGDAFACGCAALAGIACASARRRHPLA
jgi:apolipoprotein N-acyltransferase